MSDCETLTRSPYYLRQAGNAGRRSPAKQGDGVSPAFPLGKQNKDLKQKERFILPEFSSVEFAAFSKLSLRNPAFGSVGHAAVMYYRKCFATLRRRTSAADAVKSALLKGRQSWNNIGRT
jgi:hypothetical protein